jgi:hypothetical protein
VVAFPDPPARDYDQDPYAGYFADPEFLMFPVQPLDERLELKERILGLAASSETIAVPLRRLTTGQHNVSIDGQSVTFEWHAATQALRVRALPPGVKAMHTFWFAWGAMHPGTEISERD